MSAIRAEGLTKSYGNVRALVGFDIEVAIGEVVALLGPNGAGKTTAVEILEGYRRPDSGTVEVLGSNPVDAGSHLRQRIGIVLQEAGLEDELTVRESIEYLRAAYEHPRDIDELITLVGLEAKADERIKRLSGGQKRRLDLALALAGSPELLFLDEPTTGFDPAARRDAWAMIEGLAKAGSTVLLTTHYLEEAQALADRVVVIAGGKVLAEGPPGSLGNRMTAAATIRFRLSQPGQQEILGVMAGPDGSVTISTHEPTSELHRLTGLALDNHIDLEALEVSRPSLEDAYLELIAHHEPRTES
ncbi:MAG: ABC transporter ATP-binding protein [Actinomycetota bacterium]|nr:ABC transporter ATP-binding protein [Actinomycetota bacterium]